MNPSTWIVVADSARAHIFSLRGNPKKLESIRELTHPQSRLSSLELVGDKPGRMFESVGQVRHAVTQSITPQKAEKQKFCLEVARHIEWARKEGMIDRLVLVAPPAFLGPLRGHLTAPTARLVTLEMHKNLAGMTPDVIRHHLPDELFE